MHQLNKITKERKILNINSFTNQQNNNKEDENNQYDVIYCEDKIDGISVEVAMQYNGSYQSMIYSFCNNINTADGGTHEEGFRLALTRVINRYGKANKFLKENDESFCLYILLLFLLLL